MKKQRQNAKKKKSVENKGKAVCAEAKYQWEELPFNLSDNLRIIMIISVYYLGFDKRSQIKYVALSLIYTLSK